MRSQKSADHFCKRNLKLELYTLLCALRIAPKKGKSGKRKNHTRTDQIKSINASTR